jgi:hypothetical protein
MGLVKRRMWKKKRMHDLIGAGDVVAALARDA